MLMFFVTIYAAFCLVAMAFWLSKVGLIGPNLCEIEMDIEERYDFNFKFITCFFIVSMVLLLY